MPGSSFSLNGEASLEILGCRRLAIWLYALLGFSVLAASMPKAASARLSDSVVAQTPPSHLRGTCANSAFVGPGKVATIAGGGAGIRDGSTGSAQFEMPSGIAVRSDGALVVADAGAQRIRLIQNGRVSTLAGSGSPDATGLYVRGGYKDGAAQEARFNHPSAIAIQPGGDIFIADVDNNAVRRISKGIVSTFMGGPEKKGPDLGNVSDVTASRVSGLATDSDGNIYVANGRGLRIVDRQGRVSLFRNEVKEVLSVAVYGAGAERAIFEVTASGIEYYGPRDAERHIRADGALTDNGQNMIAAADLIGYPVSIVAINQYAAAFTDLVDGTVYVVDAKQGNIEAVAGSRLHSESADESRETDGMPADARFDAPWGIGYDSGKRLLYVADAGGRRIRSMGPLYLRGQDFDSQRYVDASANVQRIALIGNSFAYFHTDFHRSIEGELERRLTAQSGRCVFVDAINLGSDLRTYKSYIESFGSLYDVVVVQINGTHVEETFGVHPPRLLPYDRGALVAAAGTWGPQLTALVQGLNNAAKGAGAKFVVVSHPYPYDVSPNEFLWNRFFMAYGNPDLSVSEAFNSALGSSLSRSHVPYYNMYEDFRRAESERKCALFGTKNDHFSVCGRELVASVLARQLRSMDVLKR